MSLDLFMMLAIAGLLIVSCIAVRLKRSMPLPEKQESLPPPTPAPTRVTVLPPRRNQDRDQIFIEYVPADLHKLVVGFKASVKVQAELLLAGDTLLRKLPINIRESLGRPISCDLIEWLSQGGSRENIIPERARAAIAVAETSQALWSLMFKLGYRVDKFSYQVALDKYSGVVTSPSLQQGNDRKFFASNYIVRRIIDSTGVNFAVATALWRYVLEILREDFVSIPGVRIKQPEEYYSDISIEAG